MAYTQMIASTESDVVEDQSEVSTKFIYKSLALWRIYISNAAHISFVGENVGVSRI